MTRQEELQQVKLKRLAIVQSFRKSEYYDFLFKPLLEEIEKLKNAYDCKTLQEIATLKGEYKGLTFLPNLLTGFEQEGEFASEQEKKIAQRKAIEESDLDTRDI